MGNMPRWWAGAAAALAAGLLVGAAGWYVGDLVGARLADGFTFDWYVHAPEPKVPVPDALRVAAMAAGLAAFVGVSLTVGPAALLTRKASERMRHAPPRYRDPLSLDVHAVRLLLGLATAAALLAILGGFVLFSNEGVRNLTPRGYRQLVALAAAAGAGAAAALTAWSTFRGFVTGRVVSSSPKNVMARVSLFAMRNAKTTVAVVLATTVVAGYYATMVTTNVDVADVLPRGDPNTAAAHNLTSKFKSSFTQQVTFQFHVLDMEDPAQAALYEENNATIPARKTDARPGNISDEVYVRAIAETIAHVVAQEPFAGSIASADIFKLVNWTMDGGQNSSDPRVAFGIPPTDELGELRYRTVEEAVFGVGALYAAVDAVTSPNWTQTAVLVTVSPTSDVPAKVIGQRALEVRDGWVHRVRMDQTNFTVFGPENPPLFSVDLPLANAHASQLTADDFRLLMPLIGVFVAVTLFIAFRNVASVIVTFSALAIAVTWTLGAMGALGYALNTINLAVIPLIMGVGIDYGIHMMNEFQEYRSQGKTPEEAWTLAGGGSAFALFVGAITTIAGLFVMVISPSLLVSQLGMLGIVAMVACYTLAVVFIPAAYTLLGGGRAMKRRQQYQPSRLMPAFAYGVSRARVLVLVLLLLVAGAAVASQQNLRREAFGDPPRNWLPGDPLREEHLRAIEGFYETGTDDVKANVIILEGDVTDPAMHDYINGITGTLRRNALAGEYRDPATNETRESRVIADTLRDLPFLLNTWLTVKDGVPGVAAYLGAPALEQVFDQANLQDPTGRSDPYPRTQADIRRELDGVFQSPLRQFGNLFVDAPDYEMTVIVFSVRAATYPDAESVWNEVQAAILENEPLRPEGTKTSFFGNTAINYLFVAKQVPWLNAMNMVSVGIVVLIVALFTRRLGPTLAVAGVSALASTLWFGLLPVLDIGLAISLTLPLIFISAMGSDYALHLSLRASRTKNPRETFEGVGKGVLFSFVTTFGAFVIFTRISDLAGRRSIVATCLAIAVVFVVTLLIVPLIYPIKRGDKGHAGGPAPDRNVPVVESRTLEVAGPAQAPPRTEAKR